MKISFRRIAQSITGFSTPVGGVSWTPPRLDVDVVSNLITFLEDRRALFNPLEMEQPSHVIKSVQQIRRRLTEDLQKIDRDSELAKVLRTMRVACREFIGMGMQHGIGGSVEHGTSRDDVIWLMSALMDLRAVLGTCIGQLCTRYGLDIEEGLASIVPSFQTQKLLESAQDDEDSQSGSATERKGHRQRQLPSKRSTLPS